MKITLLGTGTSQGVPVVGCRCSTCLSKDPRDNRLRSGVLIEQEDTNILIDTSPDLRMQMLVNNVEKVDAILYTHEHNDHVVGLDDIRPFNFKQQIDMPLIGLERVLNDIKYRFNYVFLNSYPGAPKATINIINGDIPVKVKGVQVTPIKVMHGQLPILGYRVGDFTFITDASYIDSVQMDKIRGSRYIVVNALRREPHGTHFTFDQAINFLLELRPEKGFLTHVSHDMGPTRQWENDLPDSIFPAYDGMQLEL